MGRAIIRQPSVFLMDEPLSNLDAKLRVQMRADIAALQARLGVTTVYVTHDQSEAMTLGHRVAVLQDGAPPAVRHAARAVRPAGEHVRRRLHRLAGDEPLHACRSTNGSVALGGVDACRCRPRGERAREVVVGLRPEALELAADGIAAEVEVVEEFGADAFVFCVAEIGGERTKLVARVDARRAPRAASACRCARAPPRRTCSTRRPASG